jgi:small subunit ribosomal protein S6
MSQPHQYELVYIIQPDLNEEETKAVDDRITQSIVNNGGQILSTEVWGRRKLAYPIRKHFEGYYTLHNVEMPPTSVAEVERILRLTEDVLRFLVIRPDEA